MILSIQNKLVHNPLLIVSNNCLSCSVENALIIELYYFVYLL